MNGIHSSWIQQNFDMVLLLNVHFALKIFESGKNSHNQVKIGRLPTRLMPFIGREKELAETNSLLSDPDCQLLSLIEPGGIGLESLRKSGANLALPSRFQNNI
jgi:hypothetical protein